MNYLLIGGSAVSGQAAIKAIRNKDKDSFIISTSSGERDVTGADETIYNIDLNELSAPAAVAATVADRPVKMLMYIPAMGKVAMPAVRSKADEVLASHHYSVIPMLKLIGLVNPGYTICLSGFIWFENLLCSYGAMTFTKISMEQLAIKYPDKFRVIRAGMFKSNSVRGISLLVQRELRGEIPEDMKDLYDRWKESGQKFKEFFEEQNNRVEKESYEEMFDTPYRLTEDEDLTRAVEFILDGTDDPIINLIGNWIWTEREMPPIPDHIMKMAADLIPSGLEDYMDPGNAGKP